MPNDSEILRAIEDAKNDALEDAKRFGIVIDSADISCCPLKPIKIKDNETVLDILHDEDFYDDSELDDSEDETDNGMHFYDRNDYASGSTDECELLNEFNFEFHEVDPEDLEADDGNDDAAAHSNFVEIETKDGQFENIKKSRFMWNCSKGHKKLSSDRVHRVRATETIEIVENPGSPSGSRKRRKVARK